MPEQFEIRHHWFTVSEVVRVIIAMSFRHYPQSHIDAMRAKLDRLLSEEIEL